MKKERDNEEILNIDNKSILPKVLLIVLFLLVGIGSLGVGIYLQDNNIMTGYKSILVIVGFLGSWSLALIVLLRNMGDFLAVEMFQKAKKYDEKELVIIPFCHKGQLESYLAKSKYEEIKNGLFCKRKFHFCKDFVYYYMKSVSLPGSVDSQDRLKELESAIERNKSSFYMMKKKGNKNVLVLFLYQNQLTNDDLEDFKVNAIASILASELQIDTIQTSVFPVLVDTTTNMAYYLRTRNPFSITLYGYGCRYIKRLSKRIKRHH